jgi:hypothetical protein
VVLVAFGGSMRRLFPRRTDEVVQPGGTMALTMTKTSTNHHNRMIPPSRQHKARWKQLRLQIWPISFKYLRSPLPPHAQ